MGNKATKTASPPAAPAQQHQPAAGFQPLKKDTRAFTFDDRVSSLKPAAFQPLRRAMTLDSRRRETNREQHQKQLDELLFRRHFNAVVQREDLQSLNRISDCLDPSKQSIVVVDPMSTGMCVAQEVMARGYACIAVFSDSLPILGALIKNIPVTTMTAFSACLFHDGSHSMDTILASVQGLHMNIVAVLPGAETGVQLADFLADKLNLRSNGMTGSTARRNKYEMGEKIRHAGLRAVQQCSATTWSQVLHFIDHSLTPTKPFQVIVKPEESAGSDDVCLCTNMEQVQQAYGKIQGKINRLGLENAATLIQEYLCGTEFVVDTVSRDGVHKVVAVWEYDKRSCNDAPFVYFGVHLRAVQGPVLTRIVQYVLQVLTALEIQQGPGHAEVKFVNGEPCLIEIGARCHGGDGTFICMVDRCLGYNQVSATIDAFVDADSFEALPALPTELLAHCAEVTLVSYSAGTVLAIPGLSHVQQMASFLKAYVPDTPVVSKSIDLFSSPGSVMLLHEDPAQLMQDHDRIRTLELAGDFFQLQELRTPEIVPCVALVDPFSTGAVLAQQISRRGYSCICVYSDSLENMAAVAHMVPDGVELNFTATIGFTGSTEGTAEAILKAVEAQGGQLLNVFAGAETGVRLTDQLTHYLKLRGNVIETCNARRDKYEMGETLRSAGVRAVRQTKATTWAQVHEFITEWNPTPFQVILKPLESAGSDGVTLCTSIEEAETAFEALMGKINGVGLINEAVLVQEFLEGIEYVVDTVSRDGEHKIAAVWRYDKQQVNDAAFVYFGVNVQAIEGFVHDMITYQFSVLDALGIRNGPGHGEVKYCRGEPVLVEVGARCHGGEGTYLPIANACFKRNQVEMYIDSMLDEDAFKAHSVKPGALSAVGCEVKFVCYKEGILKGVPALPEIEQMKSFVCASWMVHPGQMIYRTIDAFTTPGGCNMLHEDPAVLQADIARIRQLETEGLLFDVQDK